MSNAGQQIHTKAFYTAFEYDELQQKLISSLQERDHNKRMWKGQINRTKLAEQQITKLEAACAEMRQHLIKISACGLRHENPNTPVEIQISLESFRAINRTILSTTSGQRILEKLKLYGEYASATQYWKIEPHDQKERTAFLAKLLLISGALNPTNQTTEDKR